MDQDRYELIEVIGNGGMATVWRARDRRLDRLVAVKRPTREADHRRFVHEGRLAAGIVHPNVVRVYDVGADDDGPYLVMELVDGPSVAEADVAQHDAASIGAEIASALAALHVAGIVHGDVKPANILLDDDGARLTDFGVARRSADATTGPVWATPSYAAPEVAAGGAPTSASDVYSLAIVLHEIVTGVDWSTPAATQPMPTGDWAGILAPALATDPADRPDAASFARSLERLTPGGMAAPATVPVESSAAPPIPAPPIIAPPARRTVAASPSPIARRPSRSLVGAAFLGVLALVVGVAAVAAWSGDDVASTQPPTSITTSAPGTAAPVTTAAVTTAATSVTTMPATIPATMAAPTTVTTETTSPTSPVDAIASEFVALVDGQPPKELKPKDARSLLERLDRVVERANDQRDVDKELDELAKRAADHLSGEARDRARDLVLALAGELGADTDQLAARFDDAGG